MKSILILVRLLVLVMLAFCLVSGWVSRMPWIVAIWNMHFSLLASYLIPAPFHLIGSMQKIILLPKPGYLFATYQKILKNFFILRCRHRLPAIIIILKQFFTENLVWRYEAVFFSYYNISFIIIFDGPLTICSCTRMMQNYI